MTRSHLAVSLPCAGLLLAAFLIGAPSPAALPPPPASGELAPWPMDYGPDVPGVVSASALLDKPAGRLGPVVVRDGHFFTGDRRLRFWGASIAFGGALPTHEQADRVARRLAHFGVNCIRFHHIDNQPFPNGLFADRSMDKLSPEALDRLDYFVAALKSQGIYSDLNLHVSRWWSRLQHWPDADKLPEYDKQLDIFYPELIAANKQYARDLLTHVNAYTHAPYTSEPAVAFVEINNEDTLFLWGGEDKLAQLPGPYAAVLQQQWNAWLTKKYPARANLADAWSAGAEPEGPDLLKDPEFHSVGGYDRAWVVEQHDSAHLSTAREAGPDGKSRLKLDVSAIDGVDWHVQLSQAHLALKKGQFYTLQFTASAAKPVDLTVSVGQAHEPWSNLGLSRTVALTPAPKRFALGFVAGESDDNARVSFLLGRAVDQIVLSGARFAEGGQRGLAGNEDPARGSVARGGLGTSDTPQRSRDWYDFLQQTDQAYFTGMRRFLKDDLGVRCPVTGTIGLGALGTESQSHMDFVDAHAYWQHPSFPHRQWDMSDWTIPNTPMVDDPAGAALWGLAATRVAGKPFTVTEYQHPNPNEWQAEGEPMLATYAALQDWDGLFLFDYVDKTQYEPAAATDFFSLEGNAVKMAFLPFASRLFVGGAIEPTQARLVLHPPRRLMLDTASRYFYQQWPFLRDQMHVTWQDALTHALALDFEHAAPAASPPSAGDPRIAWTSPGPASGAGQFRLKTPSAAVFVGFAKGGLPIDLGPVTIESMQSPFAVMMLLPDRPGETIEQSSRLLLCIAARETNTGQVWDPSRHTVSNHWGGPPPLVEVVHASLRVSGPRSITAYALTPAGQRGKAVPATSDAAGTVIHLGGQPTIWYELDRKTP